MSHPRTAYDLLLLAFCATHLTTVLTATTVHVSAQSGNLILENGAERKVLTHSGKDSDPWLTPDGRSVVFIRRDGVDDSRTSVRRLDLSTNQEANLFSGPVDVSGQPISSFSSPRFGRSEATLFFVVRTGVTTGEIAKVDSRTGAVALLAPGMGVDIIRAGPQAGSLLAYQRRIDLNGFPFYVYWLYSEEGVDLGIAGPAEMNVEAVVDYSLDQENEQNERERNPRPPPQKTSKILAVSNEVAVSRRVKYVAPAITRKDLQSIGDRGEVQVRVVIGESGDVREVQLVSGSPVIAEAVLRAVRQWRFKPLFVQNKPARVSTVFDILVTPAEARN